jgi:predicted esterase
MGYEIVYCYQCGKRMAEGDFQKGEAFRILSRTTCRKCAGGILVELPPEVQAAILTSKPRPHGLVEIATVDHVPPQDQTTFHRRRRRKGLRTTATVVAPAAIGMVVVIVILLTVVMSWTGGSRAVRPPPSAAPARWTAESPIVDPVNLSSRGAAPRVDAAPLPPPPRPAPPESPYAASERKAPVARPVEPAKPHPQTSAARSDVPSPAPLPKTAPPPPPPQPAMPVASSQTPPKADPERPVPAGNREDELRQLINQLQGLFDRKAYAEAERTCARLCELSPRNATHHYNHACAFARLGRANEALAALERSVQKGFHDAEHMQIDEDLASLRGDPRYAAAVKMVRQNGGLDGATYEPGANVPGVKTVERQPVDGFRYRIRMGDGISANKPHRLIVWFHPNGRSMNATVERLAPQFARRGFALMVLTQKSFRAWTGVHLDKLMKRTLPDVAQIPGVDVRKPVLMGSSDGGLAALYLWHSMPLAFGGLLICAAFPVNQGAEGINIEASPKTDGAPPAPIFALIGTADDGAKAWQRAEAPWRAAGVPLSVHYLKDKTHTYLFDGPVMADVYAWIEKISLLPAAEKSHTTKAPNQK